MQDSNSKRSRVNRRNFVKGAAALGAASGAGAFGLPWAAWAQDVPYQYDGSKFRLVDPDPEYLAWLKERGIPFDPEHPFKLKEE